MTLVALPAHIAESIHSAARVEGLGCRIGEPDVLKVTVVLKLDVFEAEFTLDLLAMLAGQAAIDEYLGHVMDTARRVLERAQAEAP